jgi:hypothetical protein
MHPDDIDKQPTLPPATPAVGDPSPKTPTPTPPASLSAERRRRSGRRWVAGVAAVLALTLVGVGAGMLPPGSPLWTVARAQTTSQVDPQTAAIQQVIQRANDEQAQAIAANNTSLMSDTATAAHYQELVKINQDLVANGVTGISLVKLDWGPISVNGATATATSYETWTTTSSDGTTTQSLDTNVYTLVQQNGAWVVQADAQPGQAAGQPSASVGGQAPASGQPAPQAPVPFSQTGNNTSHNWSGYAATSGGRTYTSVTGTWTVPQPAANGTPGVGATWVGIGGVNSRDLIQAGTQDMASGTGQSQYQAWIEMLPSASQQVPLAVKPGDSVTVSIDKQTSAANTWQISFTNNTTGQTYQKTVHYASSQSSAEWVEEAPSGQSGILPIDNFGSVNFTAASATQAGQTVNLTQAGAQPISLLGANGQALAVPSAIGSDGSSFTVARTSAPSTPATPRGRGGISVFPNGPQPVIPFN